MGSLLLLTEGHNIINIINNQKVIRVGVDVEKLEPLYTVGGNIIWGNCYGKQYGVSSKN